MSEAFHFCVNEERAKVLSDYYYGNLVMHECTLSPGTRYMLDATGLGVANRIIVNKNEL